MKLLVAIQYWEGDRDDALKLGRLIADLEPKKRDDVEVVFAHRFDARPPDEETLSITKKKFSKVSVFKNARKATGWPDGCNALWLELMNWACLRVRDNDEQIDAVLTWEGDDVPMRRDWIDVLKKEWQSKKEPWVMSHFVNCPKKPHWNGNMMVHPMLPVYIPGLNFVPPLEAWDTWNYQAMKPHGYDTPFIFSERFLSEINFPHLCKRKNPDIALAYRHGIKDPAVKDIVRKILKKTPAVPADWKEAERLYLEP
jgi:hypothetical protein